MKTLFALLLLVSSSAQAAICDPGAPPECFGRPLVGSTYVSNERGGQVRLTIHPDHTVAFTHPTWGHPGGPLLFQRLDSHSFEVRLFFNGHLQDSLRFEVIDQGRRIEQYDDLGKLLRTLTALPKTPSP